MKEKDNTYIVAYGSNIDPEKNVDLAIHHLKKIFGSLVESTRLRTKAVGMDAPDFINGAIKFQTSLPELEVKKKLLAIESSLGRKRTLNKNAPRTIDLDIIVVNGEIVHPDYERYDFVKKCVDELTSLQD